LPFELFGFQLITLQNDRNESKDEADKENRNEFNIEAEISDLKADLRKVVNEKGLLQNSSLLRKKGSPASPSLPVSGSSSSMPLQLPPSATFLKEVRSYLTQCNVLETTTRMVRSHLKDMFGESAVESYCDMIVEEIDHAIENMADS
jgi:hypothetical protein